MAIIMQNAMDDDLLLLLIILEQYISLQKIKHCYMKKKTEWENCIRTSLSSCDLLFSPPFPPLECRAVIHDPRHAYVCSCSESSTRPQH
jgi:hypothetical protein